MLPYLGPFVVALAFSFLGVYINSYKYRSSIWLKINYILCGILAPIAFLFISKFEAFGICAASGLIIGSLCAFLILLNKPAGKPSPNKTIQKMFD